MYVRLAFAVAAHLESEILIVDEVLAVGDAQFQKKCMGKMQNVSGQGRTVLFVSHNMAAISQLCNRTMLLERGELKQFDETRKVIENYLTGTTNTSSASMDLTDSKLRVNSTPNSLFKWTEITLKNALGVPSGLIQYQEPFTISFKGAATKDVHHLFISCVIQSAAGYPIGNTSPSDFGSDIHCAQGSHEFTVTINPNPLAPGHYSVGIGANAEGVIDWLPATVDFTISDTNTVSGHRWGNNRTGMMYLPYQWTTSMLKQSKR